jgi:predicted signal transduction protein with EAL and GGDEF domain
VLEAVRHPVVVDEHELYVTTSVGIAIFPDDGEDAEALLKNADRAMYRAKELGRDNYQYATPAKFEIADGRLAMERRLRRALEREEFVLHYQPMVEIATGRSSAPRRWCGGIIPTADSFSRRTSSRSPKKRSSSCRSARGCCAPPVVR